MGLEKTAKELIVYQQAYALAMEVFEISKELKHTIFTS